MMFEGKRLEDLSEHDLLALVENKVTEGRDIEYKGSLFGNSDDDKKEFMADISSFANAIGGFLFFGIDAKQGIPTELCGIETTNPDAEILRLESSIRDGIEPHLTLHSRAIPLQNGRYVIALYIPRSWMAPHRIKYKRWAKFWSRTSNGKYELDVAELRSAFLRSETEGERIRAFRADRLSKIMISDTPVMLPPGKARLVLHLVPLNAFDLATRYDITAPQQNTPVLSSVHPISVASDATRINFDGILKYGTSWSGNEVIAYVQLFRNGIIESVDSQRLMVRGTEPRIPSVVFEEELIVALRAYLAFLKQLGVESPILVMLSLLGVGGFTMAVDPSRYALGFREYPIDRDTLLIPEVLIEDLDSDSTTILRPCFDAVWNAAGWSRSPHYNEHGQWVRPN